MPRCAASWSRAVPALVDRVTEAGDGYQRTRRAFNMLLGNAEHGDAVCRPRLIGGVYVNRSHKGDPDAKPPFVIVEPAKQREALALLRSTSSAKAVRVPAGAVQPPRRVPLVALGNPRAARASDYPVRDTMLGWQDRILSQLLSDADAGAAGRLGAQGAGRPGRLHRGGIAGRPDRGGLPRVGQDASRASSRPASRPSARSAATRSGCTSNTSATWRWATLSTTDDCQTLVFVQLEGIEARINAVLLGKAKLDPYTQAHLKESSARIHKILDARLQLRGP